MGQSVIASTDLEAAIRALRFKRRKICKALSISENPVRRFDKGADEFGLNKETGYARAGIGEGD